MAMFGQANKATEMWLEKNEESETRRIQGMYRHIQGEANAAVRDLGLALALYHKGMEKEASNYVKYAYGAINSTISGIEMVEKEEYKLLNLANQIAGKVPKDKAFEENMKRFVADIKAKTNDLLVRAKNVMEKERPAIAVHENISKQEAIKYIATFQEGITIFHNISSRAGEIANSFDRLYRMELNYLKK